MAADQYVVGSGPINVGSTELCVLAVNTAASRRITINAVRVSCAATTAQVFTARLARITNTPAGTAIPAIYGPNAHDPAAPAALTTALTASTASPGAWTTAPTKGAILWELQLATPASWTEWPVPGEEWDAAISSWVGVFLTCATTTTACYAQLVFTE